MEVDPKLLEKWSWLVEAGKKYWIDSEPTGLSDEVFNTYETQAAREGLFVRDYVMDKYLKGTKTKNKYIEKIPKYKVTGSTMIDAIEKSGKELGIGEDDLWCVLKYDGSSLAIYLDPTTGTPKRVVTVGNLNLDNYGVDQTWKLINFLPKRFPKGIVAIQAEALIDTDRLCELDPDKARQKANGLINSKYCEEEVSSLLTLRAYRYYTDDSEEGNKIKNLQYGQVLNLFKTVRSSIDSHVLFSPAQAWRLSELKKMPGFAETDRTRTNTGVFLNDGWVLYNNQGICQRALKYSGAGSGTEAIKTTVRSIQWNDQTEKGKDSWSANIIIDPVSIKGCTVRKPSAGSVSKLIKNNITPGAIVGIILANSTIPMVGEVFSSGNGDFQMPVCSCGYTLSPTDIYGSLLKCGNPDCSCRLERMRGYLKSCGGNINLNELLVIDRWKWENTDVDLVKLKEIVHNRLDQEYYNYLRGFLRTDLQKRNFDLVWLPSWKALVELW